MLMNLFLLAALSLVATATVPALSNTTFFNPTQGNGTFFDDAGNTLGEPLNVIISGTSSPEVLTDVGILQYAQAIGFSTECLDLHLGAPQHADLGDGNGPQPQLMELREDYGNPSIGTCIEELIGGNHFRVWRQNGTSANTGALFLAVSSELGLLQNHTIAADGYNRGRDLLVTEAIGQKSFNGTTYITTAQNLTGIMPAGSVGVNHNISVDGMAVLLTVTIDT